MTKHRLTLDHSLPKGRLTPYFEALAQGKALAECCSSCGRVQFPPGGICGRCDAADLVWTSLSGDAVVIHRTDTPDRAFALVRFEGAKNSAVVAIANPDVRSSRARLVISPASALGLTIELNGKGNEHV